jgi:putative NADH-flavin reductase
MTKTKEVTMKIAIIGATGGTGKKAMAEALDLGHQVIAVARNPSMISLTHSNLELRKGDVLDADSIEAAIAGADAVVSAIGTERLKKPTTFYSAGTANIITAMKANGVKRIVAIGSNGYVVEPRQSFFIHFILTPIVGRLFRHIWDDLMRMEDVLAESTLDWTVVRPPRLTNGKLTKKYRVNAETIVGGASISRADLADYMISHLSDPNTFQKAVCVAY